MMFPKASLGNPRTPGMASRAGEGQSAHSPSSKDGAGGFMPCNQNIWTRVQREVGNGGCGEINGYYEI